MTELRQAATLALEALEWVYGGEPLPTKEREAIIALKAALEQPEQPHRHQGGDMSNREVMQQALEALESGLAFDTHSDVLQNLRTALAMHQVSDFAQAQEQQQAEPVAWDVFELRLYGAPQEKQHRVLWVDRYTYPDGSTPDLDTLLEAAKTEGGIDGRAKTLHVRPLYTTQPQRQLDKTSFNDWWDSEYDDSENRFEQDSAAYWAWAGWQAAKRPWVGLTDDEILEAAQIDAADTWVFETAYAIETKLKERNHD